ncbi:hypothetical protein GOP47_0016961 [Adiantum capillus-veneris]|uniref:Response regulatory domain-containing protein n=1 Tax=Adiantum capillus-veneris TaxID=13818 RepID=A0A9D4UIN7_ADICA|nr:hypothetical protein GOP47_0016961 [Adiantum capillus-veneris]
MVIKEAQELKTSEVLKSASPSLDAEPAEVHVLAVDDSLIDRRVIERLLKTSAYKVTTVDSGIRALEILGIAEALGSVSLNAFQFNLVITDYCMPGMTGYDLLKKIKGTSALKEIPVVIMSSENVPTRISSCLAEGAEEFLLKPVQLADVKRLRGHVRHCGGQQDVDVPILKRKAPVEEVLLQGREKRSCLTSVTAT